MLFLILVAAAVLNSFLWLYFVAFSYLKVARFCARKVGFYVQTRLRWLVGCRWRSRRYQQLDVKSSGEGSLEDGGEDVRGSSDEDDFVDSFVVRDACYRCGLSLFLLVWFCIYVWFAGVAGRFVSELRVSRRRWLDASAGDVLSREGGSWAEMRSVLEDGEEGFRPTGGLLPGAFFVASSGPFPELCRPPVPDSALDNVTDCLACPSPVVTAMAPQDACRGCWCGTFVHSGDDAWPQHLDFNAVPTLPISWFYGMALLLFTRTSASFMVYAVFFSSILHPSTKNEVERSVFAGLLLLYGTVWGVGWRGAKHRDPGYGWSFLLGAIYVNLLQLLLFAVFFLRRVRRKRLRVLLYLRWHQPGARVSQGVQRRRRRLAPKGALSALLVAAVVFFFVAHAGLIFSFRALVLARGFQRSLASAARPCAGRPVPLFPDAPPECLDQGPVLELVSGALPVWTRRWLPHPLLRLLPTSSDDEMLYAASAELPQAVRSSVAGELDEEIRALGKFWFVFAYRWYTRDVWGRFTRIGVAHLFQVHELDLGFFVLDHASLLALLLALLVFPQHLTQLRVHDVRHLAKTYLGCCAAGRGRRGPESWPPLVCCCCCFGRRAYVAGPEDIELDEAAEEAAPETVGFGAEAEKICDAAAECLLQGRDDSRRGHVLRAHLLRTEETFQGMRWQQHFCDRSRGQQVRSVSTCPFSRPRDNLTRLVGLGGAEGSTSFAFFLRTILVQSGEASAEWLESAYRSYLFNLQLLTARERRRATATALVFSPDPWSAPGPPLAAPNRASSPRTERLTGPERVREIKANLLTTFTPEPRPSDEFWQVLLDQRALGDAPVSDFDVKFGGRQVSLLDYLVAVAFLASPEKLRESFCLQFHRRPRTLPVLLPMAHATCPCGLDTRAAAKNKILPQEQVDMCVACDDVLVNDNYPPDGAVPFSYLQLQTKRGDGVSTSVRRHLRLFETRHQEAFVIWAEIRRVLEDCKTGEPAEQLRILFSSLYTRLGEELPGVVDSASFWGCVVAAAAEDKKKTALVLGEEEQGAVALALNWHSGTSPAGLGVAVGSFLQRWFARQLQACLHETQLWQEIVPFEFVREVQARLAVAYQQESDGLIFETTDLVFASEVLVYRHAKPFWLREAAELRQMAAALEAEEARNCELGRHDALLYARYFASLEEQYPILKEVMSGLSVAQKYVRYARLCLASREKVARTPWPAPDNDDDDGCFLSPPPPTPAQCEGQHTNTRFALATLAFLSRDEDQQHYPSLYTLVVRVFREMEAKHVLQNYFLRLPWLAPEPDLSLYRFLAVILWFSTPHESVFVGEGGWQASEPERGRRRLHGAVDTAAGNFPSFWGKEKKRTAARRNIYGSLKLKKIPAARALTARCTADLRCLYSALALLSIVAACERVPPPPPSTTRTSHRVVKDNLFRLLVSALFARGEVFQLWRLMCRAFAHIDPAHVHVTPPSGQSRHTSPPPTTPLHITSTTCPLFAPDYFPQLLFRNAPLAFSDAWNDDRASHGKELASPALGQRLLQQAENADLASPRTQEARGFEDAVHTSRPFFLLALQYMAFASVPEAEAAVASFAPGPALENRLSRFLQDTAAGKKWASFFKIPAMTTTPGTMLPPAVSPQQVDAVILVVNKAALQNRWRQQTGPEKKISRVYTLILAEMHAIKRCSLEKSARRNLFPFVISALARVFLLCLCKP